MLVDSHCHLNYPEFSDLSAAVARAGERGVRLMQTISTKASDFAVVKGIAERHPEIYCSIGIHPHEAEQHQSLGEETLRAEASHPRVIGIGETGLDFYYEHSPRAIQEALFRMHIRVGRTLGLPVIVHSRDADEDTVRILREEMEKGAFAFLIHCFSTTAYLAEESIKLGGYISLSGIITFKKSQALRDIVVALPLDRLLVETDAPYLAPEPYRGKPNEPSYTAYVAAKLGEMFGQTPEEIARVTSDNFFRLFTKAQRPTA
jgi:TatD DNase family protein